VSSGLTTTFEVLTRSSNEAAVDLLLRELNSPHQQIQAGVLASLLERRSPAGHREVLRQLHQHGAKWQPQIEQRRTWMAGALRNAMTSSDLRMSVNACQCALWFAEFELIPTLANLVENADHPHRELAASTLLQLAQQLYEELGAEREMRRRRDPDNIRRSVLTSLERATLHYPQHKRSEALEAFLMLTPRDNAVLQSILHDPFHSVYLPVVDYLLRDSRGGILRLLLGFLDDPHASLSMLQIIGRRADPRFIRMFLPRVATEYSPVVLQNLKRIDKIVWTQNVAAVLADEDEATQSGAIRLVTSSGIKRDDQFRVIDWIARHGHASARRVAVSTLAAFQGSEANQLVTRSLEDADPQVQAHALNQLRNRGIPGALPRLITALDSPHDILRETARANLSEFTFQRFLGSFETLDDEVRLSTGNLVRKVDPHCAELLADELDSLSRTRRLRGLEIAALLQLVTQVEQTVIRLLTEDEDYMVRVRAAQALSSCVSNACMQALSDTQALDRSGTVREAAAESLELVAQRREIAGLPPFESEPPPIEGASESHAPAPEVLFG
jgi:hypothetical protein